MKKTLAIALAASVLIGLGIARAGEQTASTKAKIGTLAYLDEQYGFRGIRFGTLRTELGDQIRPTGTYRGQIGGSWGLGVLGILQFEDIPDEQLAWYVRPTDKLSLGEVELLSIEYGFARDKQLVIVHIETAPWLMRGPIEKTLIAAWGNPTAKEEWISDVLGRQEVRHWEGKRIQAFLTFMEDHFTVDILEWNYFSYLRKITNRRHEEKLRKAAETDL